MGKWISATEHRPWPLPSLPWMMRMNWEDVLFAHWPVPVATIQPYVPKSLEIDTFHGQTWLGIVPFRMSGIRLRGLPPLPFTSAFPEINVRVYVTAGNKGGVYFFSLDAANRLAVKTARFIHLPYFYANIQIRTEQGNIHFRSERRDSRGEPAVFHGTYRPVSAPYLAEPGTLEHWLTERYCLYATDKQGRLYRGEIHHSPWALQQAEADFEHTMTKAYGIKLPPVAPLLHYSKKIEVVAWIPTEATHEPETHNPAFPEAIRHE